MAGSPGRALGTLNSPAQQHAEILSLPCCVRRRIYHHAGLVPGPSDEVFDLNRKFWTTTLGFQGVLLSCRTIYEEASEVLYSSNRFAVRYSRPGCLRCLQNLRISSVKALRSLKDILAETSCHFPVDQSPGECCVDNGQCHASHDHDAPLDGIEIAKSAADPLLRFAKLQSCSLRWCQSLHPELWELAHQSVLQTCRATPPSLSPPPSLLKVLPRSKSPASPGLVSLPRELRLAILEYTDLVTPWTEVTWSRQSKAFAMRPTYCEDLAGEGYQCPPARHPWLPLGRMLARLGLDRVHDGRLFLPRRS